MTRLTDWDESIFAQIAKLNTVCFSEDERAPEGILREQWEDGDVFVWDDGVNKVKSWAIVSEKDGEPYVWAIATDPNFRGLGLASFLLDEIESTFRQQKKRFIGLTTHVDNPAQKLYFDKGYRVTKVLKGYYISGDGIYMRRKLL